MSQGASIPPKELRQAHYAKVAQMVGGQPASFANKPTAATGPPALMAGYFTFIELYLLFENNTAIFHFLICC